MENIVKRMKIRATNREKIFASQKLVKDLYLKTYEELPKFKNNKATSQIKKWAWDLNKPFTKENTEMANSTWKDMQSY